MDLLQRIQRWYTINCNGDWEHSYVVSITNVDNPGWWVTIDLQETCLAEATLAKHPTLERSPTNWVLWYIENQQFVASGGPENLSEILTFFLDVLLPEQADPEFMYEVYLPVKNYEGRIWLRAEGRVVTESVLEIVLIHDSSKISSYEELHDESYEALNNAELTTLEVKHAIGDRVEPYIEESRVNALKKLLVAPELSASE